jgi:hypothetical protein
MWTDTFDGFFFITVGGLLLAGFKYGVEFCLKSKCSEIQLCCIRIKRDVAVEAEIEARGGLTPVVEEPAIQLPPMPMRRGTV